MYGTASSRAARNPKRSVNWSLYVQRKSGTSQQDERPALDRHLRPRGEHALGPAGPGRELDAPPRAEPPRRQGERDRLAVRVEEQEERVVRDLLAVRCPLRDLGPVQEPPECVRVLALPVLLRHPAPVWPEPPDIGQA